MLPSNVLLVDSNFTFVPEKDNVGDYSDNIPEKAYKKVCLAGCQSVCVSVCLVVFGYTLWLLMAVFFLLSQYFHTYQYDLSIGRHSYYFR